MSRVVFFMGKGGVGKTTVAGLTGIYFSRFWDVEVYSMDQAHNLGDVFGVALGPKPKRIKDRLLGAEVDLEIWKKEYLNNIKSSVKKSYSYLAAYNLLDYFDLFEYAPDIEQLSMLLAFWDIYKNSEAEFLLFDMPPTALALEFFSVIERNILWLDKLIELREKIQKQKQVITNIKLGKKQIQTDAIMDKLQQMRQFYRQIKTVLQKAEFFIIENPDKLSVLEADRIVEKLTALGYSNYTRVLNKALKCGTDSCVHYDEYENLLSDYSQLYQSNQEFFYWLETKFKKQ